jgi:four helix bundle protein
MARITTFRELIVWQKAMALAEGVYRAAGLLPSSELYGLGSQLRRSSASIPANIAEGFSLHSRARYRFHVAVALGSQAELQTQLELARRLSLIDAHEVGRLEALTIEVGRLLNGLWRALSPVGVCYSLILFLVCLGLRPEAWGLFHGFSFFPQP